MRKQPKTGAHDPGRTGRAPLSERLPLPEKEERERKT